MLHVTHDYNIINQGDMGHTDKILQPTTRALNVVINRKMCYKECQLINVTGLCATEVRSDMLPFLESYC